LLKPALVVRARFVRPEAVHSQIVEIQRGYDRSCAATLDVFARSRTGRKVARTYATAKNSVTGVTRLYGKELSVILGKLVASRAW
jgi:hypothetical protein